MATISALVTLATLGLTIPAISLCQVLVMLVFAMAFIALLDLPEYLTFKKFGL